MQLSSEKWIAVPSSEHPGTYRGITALNPAKKNHSLHSEFAQVVWKMEDDERSPDCEARANLILAGPELLAALKALLDVPEYDGRPATSKIRLKAKHAARALVNRLEGEPK